MSTIQPYLFFEGRADEAAEFYGRAMGAKVEMLMRYDENPEPMPEGSVPPGAGRKVMHMELRIGDAVVMASDGHCSGKTAFNGFTLTYSAKDEAEADRVFAALADGGRVEMPLGRTFFSPKFGMVADRFGLGWMVIVPGPRAA